MAGARHEQWSAFFIFGLVGTEEFDVRSFCGHGEAAEIRTGSNFATGLVSLVTLGIYTPHKVYVTCAATDRVARSSSRRLELDLDQHGIPVRAQIATSRGVVSTRNVVPVGTQGYRITYASEAAL